MSDEQIILGFAGVALVAALPVFVYIVRQISREEAKLDAAMGALAAFLAIFGGLLVRDERS